MTDYEDALVKIECLKLSNKIEGQAMENVFKTATDLYKYIFSDIPIPLGQFQESYQPEQSNR